MVKVTVGKLAEMGAGSVKGVEVNGKKYVVANIGGFMYAMDGVCGHAGGPLIDGRLEGSTLVCPRHKAEYDVTTGRSIKKPKIPLAKAADLKTYKVTVEGDEVVLEIQ